MAAPFISQRMISQSVMGKGIFGGGGLILVTNAPMFRRAAYINAERIDKLGAQFNTWKDPLFRSLREVIIPSIAANFAQEGRAPKWAPLATSTGMTRQKLGYGAFHPILQRTGNLKRVMTNPGIWRQGAPGWEDSIFMDPKVIKRNAKYAEYHQGGAQRARRKKPSLRTFISKSKLGGYLDPETGNWFTVQHSAGIGVESWTGEGVGMDTGIDQFYEGYLIDAALDQDQYDILAPLQMGAQNRVTSRMPARPMVYFTPDDEIGIYDIFMEYLTIQTMKHWGSHPDIGR